MRTYKCTVVTLDTLLSIPLRNHNGCTTLLICRSTCYKLTIYAIHESRYWKAVTIHLSDWVKQIIYKLNNFRTTCTLSLRSICLWVRPRSRNLNLMYSVNTTIDCLVVHLNNSVTLLAVRLLSCCLHVLNSLVDRHNIC